MFWETWSCEWFYLNDISKSRNRDFYPRKGGKGGAHVSYQGGPLNARVEIFNGVWHNGGHHGTCSG